jgi:hypothetical protein
VFAQYTSYPTATVSDDPKDLSNALDPNAIYKGLSALAFRHAFTVDPTEFALYVHSMVKILRGFVGLIIDRKSCPGEA